jgi:hypothetical protein
MWLICSKNRWQGRGLGYRMGINKKQWNNLENKKCDYQNKEQNRCFEM